MQDFLNDTSLMDRTSHLLRLLFGRECPFQIDLTQISNPIEPTYSYEQAFIEKTIAHVVKVGNSSKKVFDIVDPIFKKAYTSE